MIWKGVSKVRYLWMLFDYFQVPVPSYDETHSKGELAEPVPEGHHLYKRSLEHLLNKLDFKAKKLELKRQKLIKHYALKGYFIQGDWTDKFMLKIKQPFN